GTIESPNSAVTNVTGLSEGEHTFTVSVSDGEIVTTSEVVVTVESANTAPTAEVAQTTISAAEGNTVTLDASASTDVDGDEITFEWEGPGTIESPNSAVTNVTGLSEGEHTFTVSVSDG
ncbi:PKD domain-containing protein, partial [Pseudoalteromonas sp. T1lg10]